MKIKQTVILLLIAIVAVSSCRPLPSACFPKMTPVNMYSGNIKELKFTPNSDFSFNIKDNAIGLIDSNVKLFHGIFAVFFYILHSRVS